MQKTILFIFLLFWKFVLISNTPPESILPLSQSILPIEYYVEQMGIWEQHISNHQSDANAWMNYYTAARNINILKGDVSNDLENIATQSQHQIPGTFEAHYIQYKQSGLFNRKYEELLKAHQLSPNRWEAYHELLHYYEINNDQATLISYAKRLLESGHLSPGILDWNYNALMSVSKNGVLLTQSDNDTYPAWVLQKVKHIRTDVSVINLYLLLGEEAYRGRVFNQLNIKQPFERQSNQNIQTQLKSLLSHLLQNCDRSLFLGVGTPSDLRKELSNDLYLTGLAFQHSNRQLDNLAILDYNYKQQFRTEALSTPLAYDPAETVVNHMNMNYIPSFALLYGYYLENNRPSEAEHTKTLITKIATRASRLDEIEAIFENEKPDDEKIETAIDLREIDKQMKVITPKLYASSFEVSNAEYDAFLKDLLDQRKFELLEKCQIYPTDWRSFLPEELKKLSELSMFSQGRPDAENSPILNITHEAAQIYCEWLTIAYNQSDHRKKRFKKVNFHLPSNEEWTIAAKGGRELSPYPWGGYYFRNAKGCLLANFDPSKQVEPSEGFDYQGLSNTEPISKQEEKTSNSEPILANDDGAFFTVNVDAYFPNDLGFYNMSGNVAEMVEQEGITRGGGWNDPSYFIQIDIQNQETLPSPNVGFRVFMDVIEE